MPSRRLVLAVAAGLLLAGLLALSLHWGPETSSGPVEPTPSTSTEDPSVSWDGQELERDSPVRYNPDPPLTYWKEFPGIEAAFQAEFDACFITRDGEAEAVEKVMERQKSRANLEAGKRLEIVIAEFKGGNQPVNEINEALYAELVYGGVDRAGNYLSQHLHNYNFWVKQQKTTDYQLPEEKIFRRPLDFPPEMIVAFWTGQAGGVDLPAELCSALAHARDQHILQYCHLHQELFIMGSCIEETLLALKIQIPTDEKKAAIRSFLPSFQKLQDEMDGVADSYLLRIKVLAQGSGLQVTR
jgi:hypothetical protein